MRILTNRRALGEARQEAAQWRGDALHLQSLLVDLMDAVEGAPTTLEFRPSAQAKVLLQNQVPITVRVPALADPGAPIPTALRAAKEALA